VLVGFLAKVMLQYALLVVQDVANLQLQPNQQLIVLMPDLFVGAAKMQQQQQQITVR
jgi:hypothetical protein